MSHLFSIHREFQDPLSSRENRLIFADPDAPTPPASPEGEKKIEGAKKEEPAAPVEAQKPLDLSRAAKNYQLGVEGLPASPGQRKEAKAHFDQNDLVLQEGYQKELGKLDADKAIQLGQIDKKLTSQSEDLAKLVKPRLPESRRILDTPEKANQAFVKLSKALGGVPLSPDTPMVGRSAMIWLENLPDDKFNQLMEGKMDMPFTDKEKALLREDTVKFDVGGAITKDEPAQLEKLTSTFSFKDALGAKSKLNEQICRYCDVVQEKGKDGKPGQLLIDGQPVTDEASFKKAIQGKLPDVAAQLDAHGNEKNPKKQKEILDGLETAAGDKLKGRAEIVKIREALADPKNVEKMNLGLGDILKLILAIKEAFEKKDYQGLMDYTSDILAHRNPEAIKNRNQLIYKEILDIKKPTPDQLVKAYLDPRGDEAKAIFNADNAKGTKELARPVGLTDKEWADKQNSQLATVERYASTIIPNVVKENLAGQLGVSSISSIGKSPDGINELTVVMQGDKKFTIRFGIGAEATVYPYKLEEGADKKKTLVRAETGTTVPIMNMENLRVALGGKPPVEPERVAFQADVGGPEPKPVTKEDLPKTAERETNIGIG